MGKFGLVAEKNKGDYGSLCRRAAHENVKIMARGWYAIPRGASFQLRA